jgi:hypothetical protein
MGQPSSSRASSSSSKASADGWKPARSCHHRRRPGASRVSSPERSESARRRPHRPAILQRSGSRFSENPQRDWGPTCPIAEVLRILQVVRQRRPLHRSRENSPRHSVDPRSPTILRPRDQRRTEQAPVFRIRLRSPLPRPPRQCAIRGPDYPVAPRPSNHRARHPRRGTSRGTSPDRSERPPSPMTTGRRHPRSPLMPVRLRQSRCTGTSGLHRQLGRQRRHSLPLMSRASSLALSVASRTLTQRPRPRKDRLELRHPEPGPPRRRSQPGRAENRPSPIRENLRAASRGRRRRVTGHPRMP